jgi:hypothetical protein
MDLADTEVKWPKWALAVLFLVDGAGFGTWAAHVPVFKQFLHIENGSLAAWVAPFFLIPGGRLCSASCSRGQESQTSFP